MLDYYVIQHLGTLIDKPHWYESIPQYYGINNNNFFFTIDEARIVLSWIKESEKCGKQDEFRIIHRIVTEEVVA